MKSVEDVSQNMDVKIDRMQQDINDIKQRQQQNEGRLSNMETDIHKLQVSDQLQDREISSLKEVLGEIKGDTRYIRNKIDSDRDKELDRHKNFWWKVVAALVIAALLFYFGIEVTKQIMQ